LARLAAAAAAGLLRLLLFLPLRLVVRAIIGSEAFWRRGLSNAYRDASRLTDDMVRVFALPFSQPPHKNDMVCVLVPSCPS
jgi:hypothetical protein